MKKPYSKTLLQGQNRVHLKLKKPLIAKLSGVLSSVDPERFELSVSTLSISVYGAFSLAKFCILKHFRTKPYSNSLLQKST